MPLLTLSTKVRKSKTSRLSSSLPLSILDMSSTSLMRTSRCLEERLIFLRHSTTLASFPAFCRAMRVMPMTPFMGVRISWDMRERNSLLARLARSARTVASSSFRWVSMSSVSSVKTVMYCSFMPLSWSAGMR